MKNDDLIQDDVFTEDAGTNDCGIPMPSLNEVGWLLVGGGFVGAFLSLLRKRSSFVGIAVPLGLIGLGSGLLLQERHTNIEAAEENILAELDALDPVARAQVLKAVAKDQLGRIPGVGS